MISWTWTWKTICLTYWTQTDFIISNKGLLLEKSENVLELPVKQLVIQLGLISSISKGQTIFSVCKSKC